jgi:hypothetical protein
MPVAVIVLVVVVCLVVVLFGVAMFSPARVRLDVDGGELVVSLGFWDTLLCVRGSVRVPLAQLRAVRAVGRGELPPPGLRLPGSFLPGVVTAGSYGVRKRVFWDVRRADRLLLIECQPDAGYEALVLEVPDPDGAAAQLSRSVTRS